MKRLAGLGLVIAAASLLTLHCRPVAARPDIGSPVIHMHGLPLAFTENRGQAGDDSRYLIHGPQGSASFADSSITFRFTEHSRSESVHEPFPMLNLIRAAPADDWRTMRDRHGQSAAPESRDLRLVFVGASADVSVTGCDQLAGKVNYLIGNDRLKWKTNIRTYGGVRYNDVWPGIDVIYRGEGRRLKYDVRVGAGADVGRIKLRYEGADSVSLTDSGDLSVSVGGTSFEEARPCIYQERDGERVLVDGGYTLDADTIGFHVGDYDPSLPLVIDPASDLVWSTFLGGSGDEGGNAVAVDSSDCVYMTGWTQSSDFPTTTNAYDKSHNGFDDVFVAKLSADGSSLQYCTFIGGSGNDAGYAIAVDSAGCAYVAGGSNSSDFPATTGAYDKTYNGNWDCIISKLSADGSSLLASTYVGGAVYIDNAEGLALGSSGDVYVTGYTASSDYPATVGAFQTSWSSHYDPFLIPLPDAFVTRLTSDLSSLVYSTFLGGATGINPQLEAAFDIAVDSSGCAVVTGQTYATDFPTTMGALRTTHLTFSPFDCFVTKLNSTGSALVYSTFLGGISGAMTSPENRGYALVLDSAGCACVTGQTTCGDFPTTTGAYDTSFNGYGDVFVSKLNPTGTTLVSSTLISGATNYDSGHGIALDASENVLVSGYAQCADFPTTLDAYDRSYNGGVLDGFVAKFDPTLSVLLYSTFLGGSTDESCSAVAADSQGRAISVGTTGSTGFPTAGGAYDTTWNGGSYDAFAATFQFPTIPTIASVKQSADNVTVTRAMGVATYATNGPSCTIYYIESEDRTNGIRVEDPSGLMPSLGDRIDVGGTIKTNSNDERYIEGTFVRNGTGSVQPLMMINRDVGGGNWSYNAATGAGQRGITGGAGLNNTGRLITTTGRVLSTGTDASGNPTFLIDDGSGATNDDAAVIGLKVIGTVPVSPGQNAVGRYVRVTGVSSCMKAGGNLYRLVLTRSTSDVVILQ